MASPPLTSTGQGVQEEAPQLAELAPPTRFERWSPSERFGGLRPENIDPILREAEYGRPKRWIDLANVIVDRDPHIQSVYTTRLALVAGAAWKLDPGTGADMTYAANAADFVRDALHNLPSFEQGCYTLLDAVGKGFSTTEIIWGRRNGAWVPVDLRWRSQRRFNFDDNWNIVLYDQGLYPYPGKALEPNKWITHTAHDQIDYSTKSGCLRGAAYYYAFKRWHIAWWMSACERFGAPIPVGKVPPNTKDAVRADFLAMLERISQGQGGVIDDNVNIDFIQASSYSSNPFEEFARWADEAISKIVLGTDMATQIGKNGSRAQANVGAEYNLLPRARRDGRGLAPVLERQLFRPMLDFNTHLFGGTVPPTPRITWDFEQTQKPQMYEYHLMSGVVTKNDVRDSLALPPWTDAQGGEEVVTLQPKGAVSAATSEASAAPVEAAAAAPLLHPLSESSTRRTSSRSRSLFERALKER